MASRSKISLRLIAVGVVAVGLGGLLYWIATVQNPKASTAFLTQLTQPNIALPPVSVAPSPLPFAELTIPYLRNRTYESAVSTLEKVSETAQYTSYFTSYASDGFKINALLTRPKGKMPGGGWPAVIFVHGYIPPKQYKTLENYSSYVDYLARNGLVVFKIDLRGHANSEGESGGGYYSEDYVIDTLNAYAALQKTDFVHPEKIGLWGHSMSGNVTMRAFTAKQTIPALVIWAGAVYSYEDFSQFRISDGSYQPPPTDSPQQQKRRLLFETYGNFTATSSFWRQVPATNYLDGVKGSVQVHHAVNDDVVSIDYSRNLMSILDKTSIPHELKEYSSGGHNISGNSFTAAMQATVEFFKK